MQRPQFRPGKYGRKGYACHEVDAFVNLVMAKLHGHPQGDAITAADLRVMVFHEPAKGEQAYSIEDVDGWLELVRPAVIEADNRARADVSAQSRPDTVIDMPAPPHFADRFPRVSRAVVGYSTQDVDSFLDLIHRRLERGDVVSESDLQSLPIGEQKGGYRQTAVHSTLDLVVLALRQRG